MKSSEARKTAALKWRSITVMKGMSDLKKRAIDDWFMVCEIMVVKEGTQDAWPRPIPPMEPA